MSSCCRLSLHADLIVGAFGADKAVLYRYATARSCAMTDTKTVILILSCCVFTQGSANREHERRSHRSPHHVQARGENLQAEDGE